MIINKDKARKILFEEAEQAAEGSISPEWERRLVRFSEICEHTTKTHIAFLGTAMLAKAVTLDVDVFAVKARTNEPGAFSARGLGHGVLVPHAPELEISLGVTGREPLNNQPYFRITRVSRDIPIHANARPALEALCDILETLQDVTSADEAKIALRTFIAVRRRYSPTYGKFIEARHRITRHRLVEIIEAFVSQASEGGKRAQAVAAGLMDIFAGKERVETSRINDPDRHMPGDVGVKKAAESDDWEKVLEVRDKPVSVQDLYLFAQKAIEVKAGEAAVLAIASGQNSLEHEEPRQWAAQRGVSLSLFLGWEPFVKQILFWCQTPQLEAIDKAPSLIYERIIELEVSKQGAEMWLSSVTSQN